ncbi:RAI1-domain-containing protein [Cucurbitaria berberidis CBS 394.84]|uniref:Decapping nuclease n=1 Tax=Cucurbitaria berberidis CBS 394.84 TaxID=1168544 RepID=A0A9P4LEA2_9PLEO|nr:RAI1-domain-containing protein [Cucurbitaria berberidis CBS 394.84]KAF1850909.1 RAI1-domain-containing protein [Cucurbitaria berberidis CBS 394.84]
MSDPLPATTTSDLSPSPPDRSQDTEGGSPPRKRPRTRAPPRAATSSASANAETPTFAPQPTSSGPPPVATPSEVHRFSIQPLNRFRGASASIKRPREVAHFSYDNNHEYQEDESGISYYIPPPLGADMKEGFESFRHYEDKEDPHLDSLLQALASRERQEGREKKAQGDFVTWRGMMTKVRTNSSQIMTAPFDNFAEFSMFATLHDGTIYIEEDFPSRAADRAAESSRPPQRNQHPDQQSREMMTYWGYKFETLSLIPTPPATTPREEIAKHQRSVVSNHAQHCSIVGTSFGPHSLILGGEVDGLLAPKPSDPETPIQWVELKTSEELPPPHQQQHRDIMKFERKLLKFWAQSFLLGVPKIIVGFRSKSGILRSLQTFNTHEIPGMVRRGTGVWDGNVCINFATDFLGWLKETIKDEGVYSVVLRKKSGIVEVKKVKEGTGRILSEEFLNWRKQTDTKENADEPTSNEANA